MSEFNNKKVASTISLMGVKLTLFNSYNDAVSSISTLLQSGVKVFTVAINPEKIYLANNEKKVLDAVNDANLYICDGIGAKLGAFILHYKLPRRITGIELFYEMLKYAEANHKRVFLLGGTASVNALSVTKLKQDYPSLLLAGSANGYFDDSIKMVDLINKSKADFVFVALGSPKQEFWISENRHKLHANFCMGVGGSFDVLSGTVERAPELFRKTGTEWLHRLITNPSRWRRQTALPKFITLLLKYKLHFRSQRLKK